ncbi:MAG: class I SAM-dependent methyltransferase [Patescibacteria group bacterium]|jgi:ubiquinone/menaquinone biosynthesis C-methylase UbiE
MSRIDDSRQGYDELHKDQGFSEEPEYYEVVGALVKGKKSVDIGCGYGFIEMYSPETVAVDFSEEALKVAQQNGARQTVKAPAEELPFASDEFEVATSIGVLEHCADQKKAIQEMVRVSKIQILAVHAKLPYGLELVRRPLIKFFGLKDQPIEDPLTMKQIKQLLKDAGSRVIVEGFWNYIDLRWLWKKIPYSLVKWPSHHFVIAIKTPNLERKFLGENER